RGHDIKDVLLDGIAHASVDAQERVRCGPAGKVLQVAAHRFSQLAPGPDHRFVPKRIELRGNRVQRLHRGNVVIPDYRRAQEGAHPLDTGHRIRSITDKITEADDGVRPAGSDIRQHDVQRLQISVDVGNNGVWHPRTVKTAGT